MAITTFSANLRPNTCALDCLLTSYFRTGTFLFALSIVFDVMVDSFTINVDSFF